jgi:myo-inositol-1-phosphate synthase
MDAGLSGALIGPCAYFKKSPPVQYTDEEARKMVEDFIRKYGKKYGKRGARKGKVTGKTSR